MKKMQIVIAALTWFAAPLLPGCATKEPKETAETFPIFRVTPNSSGIALDGTESYGPKSLLGFIGATPDTPSRTAASVERIQPIGGSGSLDARLGGLCAVSIERPAAYDRGTISFADTIHKWRLLIDGASVTNKEADKILYQNQLDEIPWQGAGRAFPAKLRRRTFPWGKGCHIPATVKLCFRILNVAIHNHPSRRTNAERDLIQGGFAPKPPVRFVPAWIQVWSVGKRLLSGLVPSRLRAD